MDQVWLPDELRCFFLVFLSFFLAACAASYGPSVDQSGLEQGYRSASEALELAESLNAPTYASDTFEKANSLFDKTFERQKQSPSNELIEDYKRVTELARKASLNAAKAQVRKYESLRNRFDSLEVKYGNRGDTLAKLNRKLRELRGKLKDQEALKRTIRRLKVDLVEASSRFAPEAVFVRFEKTPLFEAGSARFTSEGQRMIDSIVPTLKKHGDRMIHVRGFTDTLPIAKGADFQSNWELSAQRAINVVKYLAYVKGVRKDRLMATGMAGYHPRNSREGKAPRVRDRRVEIVLYPPKSAIKVRGPGFLSDERK